MRNHQAMTRAAYDTVAKSYTELVASDLGDKPLDRGLLAVFAELVTSGGDGAVLDAGCGSGRVAEHLDGLGLAVTGIDLSPEMIRLALTACPQSQFVVGSLLDIPISAGRFDGIVAWYSIIHTPPEQLPIVFEEFARLLRPGGSLLLAFQIGDERVRLEDVYGHRVSYDAYRLRPSRIAEQLNYAGFAVEVQVIREPSGGERQQQAYLLARL
ncbi:MULTISPECIES: class I SAM-dependent DNA methyltransferase [Nocardiaceae]|jgi:SAM-dependent methyltransferase|uniref:class I SAM-dependent DNA methyltransferase n=1 Tax=Nocardiaceae TaxID=85025 RepID=UPI001E3C840F|nr:MULTISPECIES: class I SAM-dependent methyltransferase [Rhodococcus]MCZ4277144.1 class I SAM-dependent methyltransferase [Rhodococcus yunnanensis]